MAATSAMQSILVGPVTGVAKRVDMNRLIPSSYQPRQQGSASLRVRCMAKDGLKEKLGIGGTPPPPPPPEPKVSTKFSDVLAFSGPAPERINGRLAMIGFVTAIAVELYNGEDLLAQISNGGIPWFVGTTAVLSLASLIPLFSGVTVESKSKEVMSSDAELLNGRAAMLGLVALAFTEYVIGGAIV